MDGLQPWLQAMQDLPWSTALREDALLFPVIETVHVVAIALVVGTIARLDLRLLNLSARDRTVATLAREVLPWTWGAFAVALVSGGLMFLSNPIRYAADAPFRLKLLLLLLLGLNAAVFHALSRRGLARWGASVPPLHARVAGAVSLLLWIGVVAAGRWIGFTVR